MGSIVVSEQSGVRYLHFGSNWIQGAMRIARPWALELEYTREMMLPLLLRSDSEWPRQALVIGLGAGSVSKFLFRHRPVARQTVVEIDAAVVRAAHQHFRLPEACENLRIVVDDGADFIVRARKRFDLVLVDGYDAGADAGRLTGLPFLLECKAHLSEDGYFVTNLLSRRKSFRSCVRTIAEAFDGRVLVLPPSDAGNVVAVAHVGSEIAPRLADLRIEARRLKRDIGLNLLPTLDRLESAGVCGDGRLSV